MNLVGEGCGSGGMVWWGGVDVDEMDWSGIGVSRGGWSFGGFLEYPVSRRAQRVCDNDNYY